MSDRPQRRKALTPLQSAAGILGEHYEHFVIMVNDEPHSVRLEYDNSLSALGMIETGHKLISKNLMSDAEEDFEIVWDDEDDDEEEAI
tara:strand:+ start:6960 stop:7223 length:264 start_codon:yes stop_codon:yes gene_type:complete